MPDKQNKVHHFIIPWWVWFVLGVSAMMIIMVIHLSFPDVCSRMERREEVSERQFQILHLYVDVIHIGHRLLESSFVLT